MSVETINSNKNAVEQTNDAIFSGNVDALDEYVDENVTITFSGEPDATGLDAYKEFTQSVLAAFPDLEVEVHEMVAEDDTVVQYLTTRGTHEGEFLGIEPTGNTVELTGLNLMRFKDGKIIEDINIVDRRALEQQLGTDT